MKHLFAFLLLLVSGNALAGVEVNVTSTSENISVCNLSRTTWPQESPGAFTGRLDYEDLNSPTNSPWRNRSVGLAFDGSNNQVFSFANQWYSRIGRLNMAFSYEQMGVGYKVHICYLGPVRENGPGNSDKSEKIYSLAASVTSPASSYTSTANVYYRVTTTCDLRTNRNNARQASEISPGSSMQADYSYTTNWAPFDGTFRENVMVLNDRWKQRVPRFCEVVFEFKEASTELRDNSSGNAEFNLSIDVY